MSPGNRSLPVSYTHLGQWLGENQKLSQKEQIRFAIDTALTERPEDFADFLRRMETAGIQVKHGRGGAISFLVPGQQLSLIHIF